MAEGQAMFEPDTEQNTLTRSGVEGVEAAAHSRRREQVRRAQRKHRQKKENHVRALEDELHNLYRTSIMTSELQELIEENDILRDILSEYKIPVPQDTLRWRERWAEVAIIGKDEPKRYLQVKIRKGDSTPLSPSYQQNGRSSDESATSISEMDVTPSLFSPPEVLGISPDAYSQLNWDQSLETASTEGLGIVSLNNPICKNPDSLINYDLTQLGVDFVLSLEQPCLEHTHNPLENDEPSGHAMSMQEILLANAPLTLKQNDVWKVPTSMLEKLFELAGSLGLDGYITPVQAWNRITSNPKCSFFTLRQLEALKNAMEYHMKCFGFGAVIEEEIFENLLNQSTSSNFPGRLIESPPDPCIYRSR